MGTGIANLCDEPLLRPGSPCIILVGIKGAWLGKVISVIVRNGKLIITAMIDRGPLDENRQENADHPDNGKTPKVIYHVYPDTQTFRKLVCDLLLAGEALVKMVRKCKACKHRGCR